MIRKVVIVFVLIILGSSCILAKEEASNLIPIPIIFSSPETGFGFGAMGMYFQEKDDEELQASFGGLYTTKKQANIFLDGKKKIDNVIYNLSLSYQDWVSDFYGIGNKTSLEDRKSYDSKSFKISGDFSKEIISNNYLGAIIRYKNVDLNLDEKINDDIEGSGGVNLTGVGVKYTYDTRDRNMDTKDGHYFEYQAMAYNEDLSHYKCMQNDIDYRFFKELYDGHIIAFQNELNFSSGEVPFQKLNSLGNANLMRGFKGGRYIDENKVSTQLEYRYPIYKKIRGIVFASLGEVYKDFDIDDLKKTYGLGFRYALDKKRGVNLRFDFAFGDETMFYMNLGEAF